MNLTNGTKINIQGEDFTVVDLREKNTMFQDDVSYYGRKRTLVLTGDGQGDRQDFSKAIKVNNGEEFWIDGVLYILVVKNVKACDGIMFITKKTYNDIVKMQKEIR